MTTSTLMTLGRTEPRRIVGTVNTAEFLVTAAATLGFVIGLWDDLVANLAAVLALLIGGVIAAPIAAWLVTRTNPAALGGFVGTLLVALNLPKVLPLGWGGVALLVVLGLALSWVGYRRSVTARAAAGEPVTGSTSEPQGQEVRVR